MGGGAAPFMGFGSTARLVSLAHLIASSKLSTC